jgi:murein DD-endopeptidase MepM/ murein hydrolase activator NlpD
MGKRIYINLLTFATAFLAFSMSAYSFFGDKHKADDKKKKKSEDTTRVIIKEENFFSHNDSLLMFPSHDLYAEWDTSSIHPYKKDFSNMPDSVELELTNDYSNDFVVPFNGILTSKFGYRWGRGHHGVDIDLETGDSVVAAFDGMVRIAKYNNGGYGNVVIIRHSNGLETVYGHLSKLLVEPGAEILAGETIGLGGNTGHSFGSHLHFECRYLGKALNPEDIVDFSTKELKSDLLVLYKKDLMESKISSHKIYTRSYKYKTRYKYVYKKGKRIKVKYYVKASKPKRIVRRGGKAHARVSKAKTSKGKLVATKSAKAKKITKSKSVKSKKTIARNSKSTKRSSKSKKV